MNICAKPNICIGLYAAIFFVQRQQKSISAATPAMRGDKSFFIVYCSPYNDAKAKHNNVFSFSFAMDINSRANIYFSHFQLSKLQ